MGCVSSKNTDDVQDLPLEAQENNVLHESAPPRKAIPEIQINGPSSNSSAKLQDEPSTPSKHNGAVPNHANVTPTSGGRDRSPTPPPLFPHVSPFKPQFDFRKDIALSPRTLPHHEKTTDTTPLSTQFNSHAQRPDDSGREHIAHPTNLFGDSSPGSADAAPSAQPESIIHTPQSPARTLDSEPSFEGAAPAGALDDSDKEEPCPVPESRWDAPPSHEPDDGLVSAPPSAAVDAPEEDRSAILSSFLASSVEPPVADDDSAAVVIRPPPDPEMLANQVEDEDTAADSVPAHPLLDGTGDHDHPAAGDESSSGESALRRMQTEDGEYQSMSPQDHQKLNEFLNQIEDISANTSQES